MKQRRNKKRCNWKKKHLFKHYVQHDLELAIELAFLNEDSAWVWKKRTWYENQPKWFTKLLDREFKAKCNQITRKQYLDLQYEDNYLYPIYKKNAAWYYW